MMFSTEDAVSDEPVAGAFPTDAELGRQIKRLKTSPTLNMCTETCPTVTEGVIGARFVKATCMAVDMAVNNAGAAPGNLDLINAIGMAINRACAPQGPISTAISGAIDAACAPQGTISTAISGAIERACAPEGTISTAISGSIERACAPQGAISNAIDAACAPPGAVHTALNTVMRAVEQRSLARLHNGNVYAGAGHLQPLLGRDDIIPEDFPRTYGEFARMTVIQIDVLLGSYGLADGGSRTEKLEKLSAFCNVNCPK